MCTCLDLVIGHFQEEWRRLRWRKTAGSSGQALWAGRVYNRIYILVSSPLGKWKGSCWMAKHSRKRLGKFCQTNTRRWFQFFQPVWRSVDSKRRRKPTPRYTAKGDINTMIFAWGWRWPGCRGWKLRERCPRHRQLPARFDRPGSACLENSARSVLQWR